MQRYRLLFVGSIITIVLDQLTKVWAVRSLSLLKGALPETARQIRSDQYVVFESWWNFRLTGNPGAAWGIFGGLPDGWRVPFFVVISLVAIGVIIAIYRSACEQPLIRWALTFVLGGAIGNLIDRIRLGYVVDFIDWHYKSSHWPTFNVADMAISVGVGLLILDMIVNRGQNVETEKDTS